MYTHTHTYIQIHIHINIHINIYIYIERERDACLYDIIVYHIILDHRCMLHTGVCEINTPPTRRPCRTPPPSPLMAMFK